MGVDRKRFVSNIVNSENVDRAVETWRARVPDADLKRWWSRNFRRFLLREPALLAKIGGIDELARLYAEGALALPVSAWAVRDLHAGRPVHLFHRDRLDDDRKDGAIDSDALDLVAEWMTALAPEDRHRRRLARISVPEAVRLARDWRHGEAERLAQEMREEPEDVRPVMLFDDGYRVVELLHERAFRRESVLLRNCLHNIERFADSSVYSLRDPENRPHVALEFRDGLLIQIRGFANSRARAKYQPYLMDFLRLTGVPESQIVARLGLVEMGGEVYPDIDHCVRQFAEWAEGLDDPADIPFMRDPMIRHFVNAFARHGRHAGPRSRRTVLSLFRPEGVGWLNRPGTEFPLPDTIQLYHPRLPSALLHMAKYEVLPEDEVFAAWREGLAQVIEFAAAEPDGVFDLLAENRMLAGGELEHLLEALGLAERYAATKARAREAKLAAIHRSTGRLVRELRRRDLPDGRRDYVCRVLQHVYPRLKGRLLGDDAVI